MHTIKTKTIDGYTIITGIGQLTQDPESTRVSSLYPLSLLTESKDLAAKQSEKTNHSRAATIAGKRAMESDRQAREESEKPPELKNLDILKRCEREYNAYELERKNRLGAAGLCNSDLIKLSAIVEQKHREIKINNPVFCHPGASGLIDRGVKICGWIDETTGPDGEVIPGSHAILEESELTDVLVPDGQTVALLLGKYLAQPIRTVTTVNGDYLSDFRGVTFWEKISGLWESRLVSELIDEPGDDERESGLLTETEKEEIRMQGMTPENIATEYESARVLLVREASARRSDLEIEGVDAADALTQSQAWYLSQLAILKTKYGVE